MKRFLFAIALIPLCGWLVMWAWGSSMQHKAASGQWPEHLGTIDDVPSRYPDADASAAAVELTKMTVPLAISIVPRIGAAQKFSPEAFEPVKVPLRDYMSSELGKSA